MAELKEYEKEKRLEHIYKVNVIICAILIAACGLSAIAFAITWMIKDDLPEIFALIVCALYVACVISHTSMKMAEIDYYAEVRKQIKKNCGTGRESFTAPFILNIKNDS